MEPSSINLSSFETLELRIMTDLVDFGFGCEIQIRVSKVAAVTFGTILIALIWLLQYI